MIVISCVLVVVGAALLIAGVITSGLTVIYLSIAASVVAAVLLFLGVRSSRPALVGAGGERGEGPSDAVPPRSRQGRSPGRLLGRSNQPGPETAVLPPVDDDGPLEPYLREPERVPATTASEASDVADGDARAGSLGDVMVVSGRPRYHRDGCRFLAGRADAEPISVEEAREVGFTPCGVCRPDEQFPEAEPFMLAEEPALDDTSVVDLEDHGVAELDQLDEGDGVEAAAQVAPARAPVTRGRRPRKVSEADLRPPPEPVPQSAAPAQVSPAASAIGQLPEAAGTAGAGGAVGSTRPERPARVSVVVIPDRARYHRPECRFVRDVEGTQTMSKTAATRARYLPCGVCRP